MSQSNVSQERTQMQTTFQDLATMTEEQKNAAFREWLSQKEWDEVKKKVEEQARKELARTYKEEFKEIKDRILGEKMAAGLEAATKSRKKPGKE